MNVLVGKAICGTLAGFGFLIFGHKAQADDTPGYESPAQETGSLEEIYQAALAESGALVVYAGGEVPDGNAGNPGGDNPTQAQGLYLLTHNSR